MSNSHETSSADQPMTTATTTSNVHWAASTTATEPAFAAMRRLRPSGVAPRRFSTWYERSKPVAIPVLTIAVDITAKATTDASN